MLPNLIKLEIHSFNLAEYLGLCKIESHVDPKRNQGIMIIRIEGRIEAVNYVAHRLALVDAVVPSASEKLTRLYMRMENMDEDAETLVSPRQQVIPMHKPSSEFVLVWESPTPYFTGLVTGDKYP